MSLLDFVTSAFESLTSSIRTDDSADWTNGFGTANDYQIPAESDSSFSSSDWSTFNDL